jgi:hypothetical protein
MTNYEIYRYKKHKTKTSITHALNHNLRIGKQQPNVDSTRSSKNNYSGLDTKEACNKRRDSILSGLGKKPRSNAVLAHEVVVTASPDAFKDKNFNHSEYFKDAVKHIAELHGGNQNIISLAIHYDEETPHLHVIVMPVVHGKLNSRFVIGGSAKRMSELQTLFHNQVGAKHGLTRGVIGSKKKHNPLSKIGKAIDERKAQLALLDGEYVSKLKRSESLSNVVSDLECDITRLDGDVKRLESFKALSIDELRVKLATLEQEQAHRPSMRR